MRDPPASVTVNTRLSAGISHRCLARPASMTTRCRLEEVVGRLVIAMVVLHALEDRELAAGAQMHFEFSASVDDVVVDPFAILAVDLAADHQLPSRMCLGSEVNGVKTETPCAPTTAADHVSTLKTTQAIGSRRIALAHSRRQIDEATVPASACALLPLTAGPARRTALTHN